MQAEMEKQHDATKTELLETQVVLNPTLNPKP